MSFWSPGFWSSDFWSPGFWGETEPPAPGERGVLRLRSHLLSTVTLVSRIE